MAFRDFFRGDRDHDDERRGDRWRSTSEDWRERGRDPGREARDYQRDYLGDYRGGDYRAGDYRDRGDYGRESRYGSQREWSPGGEFSEERSQGYGGEDYGRSRYGRDYERGQGDEDRNFGGDYGNRGAGSSSYGRYYPRGGMSQREGRASGEGGYGRDMDYGRRGALGYGGVGGAETGSSTLDWRQGERGQYAGKGPRGYRRSDERVREDVCDHLTEDPRIDASNMEVTVKDCEVTLSGTATSREEKRRAEDLAEGISGVKDVHNSLRVAPGGAEKMASPSARH